MKDEHKKAESQKKRIRSSDQIRLDCEGAMSPEARLVRKELLINVSEIPDWKDEWKLRREKK